MEPGNHDFTILKGTSFEFDIGWVDEDGNTVAMDGGSAHMMVRAYPESSTTLIDLTNANSRCVIVGGANSHIALRITAADTGGLSGWTHAVYDLLFTDAAGKVWPLLAGKVFLVPSVTH